MLGRDVVDVLTPAMPRSRRSPAPSSTSPMPPPSRRPCPATTWSSTPLRGPTSTAPRSTRPRRPASTGWAPQLLAAACAAAGRPAGARLHRLRLRRHRHLAVRRGRAAGARGRRTAGPRRPARGGAAAAAGRRPTSCAPHGSTASTGANFVRTMATWRGPTRLLDVVDDQVGAADLVPRRSRGARAAGRRRTHPPATYHATAGGQTTWYGLARAVFEELGADPARVRPTTTDQFPRPAPRPAYSVLGHGAWRSPESRPGRVALDAARRRTRGHRAVAGCASRCRHPGRARAVRRVRDRGGRGRPTAGRRAVTTSSSTAATRGRRSAIAPGDAPGEPAGAAQRASWRR